MVLIFLFKSGVLFNIAEHSTFNIENVFSKTCPNALNNKLSKCRYIKFAVFSLRNCLTDNISFSCITQLTDVL